MNDLTFEKKDGFDIVKMKGTGFIGELGSPMLPAKGINMIIPTDMDVESINIDQKSEVALKGKYYLYPIQSSDKKSVDPKSSDFIQPDKDIYDKDQPYPNEMIKVLHAGYFDGANRIVSISICPFQYNPTKGELTMLTNISFTLNLKSSKDQPIYVNRRSKSSQEIYDKSLEALVDNKNAIGIYGKKPKEIVDDSFYNNEKKLTKSTSTNESKPKQPMSITPHPYMIITNESLKPYFNYLKYYLISKSIWVEVVTLTDVYAYYPTGDLTSHIYDNAGKLRECLHDCYGSGTTWVLLGGDHTIVPVRYGVGTAYIWPQGPVEHSIPADLYFSDFNGDWNVNGNSKYGEIYPLDNPDYYPEVFVGRLPFKTGQEILNWTNKVIQYEQNPFAGNPLIYKKILWSESDNLDFGPFEILHNNPIQFFPTNYYQIEMKEYPPNDHPAPWYPKGTEIIDTINHGFHFYNIYNHGDSYYFAVATPGDNAGYPKYGVFARNSYTASGYYDYPADPYNGFDNITNNFTIIYSTACSSAAFDADNLQGRDCLPRAFLGMTVGGPAYIGNTRAGLDCNSKDLHKAFLKSLYVDGLTHIGQAEAFSKVILPEYWSDATDVHYLSLTNNLFGDPSMNI
jgi:hypothetical protein